MHQPPSWLETLINDATWRTLLFRLAEAHPRCLLLRYAVRRIADAGGIDVLSQAPSASAATAAAIGSAGVLQRLVVRCAKRALAAEPWDRADAVSALTVRRYTGRCVYVYGACALIGVTGNADAGWQQRGNVFLDRGTAAERGRHSTAPEAVGTGISLWSLASSDIQVQRL